MDHAKQSSTDAFKTASRRVTRKAADTTSDLIGNKTADKLTNIVRTSPKNTSETVPSETEDPVTKKRYNHQKARCKLLIS